MPKIDETVIGFAVYEDATEYIGISEVTLPEISNITEEISGAGIGGKIESVILGAIEAMSLTLNFRTVTNNAIKLHEPRQHNIDLRAAQQQKDTVRKSVGITPYLGYTESTNSKPLDLLVFVSYPPIISFFVTLLGSTELNLILSLALSALIFPLSIRSNLNTPSV